MIFAFDKMNVNLKQPDVKDKSNSDNQTKMKSEEAFR